MRQFFLAFLLLPALIGCCRTGGSGEFGVCGHPQRWERPDLERVFSAAAELGATRYRFDFDWDLIEPQQGKWDFSTFDRSLILAEKSGLQILPILGYHTPWATPGHRHRKAFLNYVETLVRRYGNRLPELELWNEPDHKRNWQAPPSGREYGELLKDVYAHVKKLNPQIQVAISGPATTKSIPMGYLEEVLKTARGSYDELFIHPYQWWLIPEHYLGSELDAVRALMVKHGGERIPLSISEIGYPSAPPMSYVLSTMDRLLNELGTRQEKVRFTVIEDPLYFTEGPAFRIRDYFPRYSGSPRAVTLAGIAALQPGPDEVLLVGPHEDFPPSGIAPLLDYVKKGGKIYVTGGFPFYHERHFGSHGEIGFRQANAEHLKKFHAAYFAVWTRPGVPKRLTGLLPAAPQAEQRELYGLYRFFDAANCQGGDRFVPVAEGLGKDFRGAVAGVYHLDSDLKGKIAVNGLSSFENTTEREQAELLPRTFLIASGRGVRKIYCYSSRSTELRSYHCESHFGLRKKDFTVKPAGKAYHTLASLRPAGAARPVVTSHHDLWSAHWRNPDKSEVLAVWAPVHPQVVKVEGKIAKVLDLTGQSLHVTNQLTATSAVTYFVGQGLKIRP